MNEEMGSTTEELETSKEELHPVNEELTTLNSELKNSVEELSRTNANLNSLLASTDIGIFLDRQLRIQRFTPSAQKIFNLVPSDMGRPLSDISSRLHYPDFIPTAEMILRDLRTIQREVRLGQEQSWYLTRLAPYRTAADRVAGVVAIFIDISRRKRAEEALRKSEERFRSLVSQATAGIAETDLEGRFTFVNDRYCEITGYDRAGLLQMRMQEITHPEDLRRNLPLFERAIETGEPFVIEKRYVRKNGMPVWVSNSVSLIHGVGSGAKSLLAVTLDINERMQARDELEQRVRDRTRDLEATNAELERTARQREQLERELLEISEREKRRIGEDLHDVICQELTATALFLRTAAHKATPECPEAAQSLNEAAQIVNRNVGLTRDLARGLQPAELKASGLNEALRGLVAQACEGNEINCRFKTARGVRAPNDTVALHMYRVAQEAVKNAVRHSGAKNLFVTLDRSEEKVCLTVQDDGKGFSPRQRGKGLGLHLMRYRANALGGELKIQRRKTGGMEITCVIPLRT